MNWGNSICRALPVLGVAFLVSLVQAQINTGRITGSVTDPSGASIAEVSLRAINEETGVVTTTTSQATGDYLLNFLVPGNNIRLEVSKSASSRQWRPAPW